LSELVVERGQRTRRRPEGVRVRVAHPWHRVPVVAGPAGQGQRPARRDHVEAPLRVEPVGHAEQVHLVGAAAVMQHEQSLRLAGGGALLVDQRGDRGIVTNLAPSTVSCMAKVIPIDEVRRSERAALFQGRGDAPVSIFVLTYQRGQGPALHLHPYPEVFVVQEGSAVFTAGDEELTVAGGNIVVVPAET